MALVVVTAPVLEPVSLQQAKDHAHVDTADDDSLIEPWIKSALKYAEGVTKRRLITQTVDYVIDRFPSGEILVPVAPLISVTSITYVDPDGATQTLATSKYQVDALSNQPRIAKEDGEVWPVTRNQLNAVTLRLVVGYGANPQDVEPEIISAMLILITHWYDHRDSVVVGASIGNVPISIKDLLMQHVVG